MTGIPGASCTALPARANYAAAATMRSSGKPKLGMKYVFAASGVLLLAGIMPARSATAQTGAPRPVAERPAAGQAPSLPAAPPGSYPSPANPPARAGPRWEPYPP
jgi:hypothetical protein